MNGRGRPFDNIDSDSATWVAGETHVSPLVANKQPYDGAFGVSIEDANRIDRHVSRSHRALRWESSRTGSKRAPDQKALFSTGQKAHCTFNYSQR